MPDNSAQEHNIRRGDVYCGRLVAMATSYTGMVTDTSNMISIDFPAMPDTIELARSAEYEVSSYPQNPDGIHVYKGTKPLEIPFNFRLHSFDKQYCKNGALTLLKLAARLHSFILPIDPTGNSNRPAIGTAAAPVSTDSASQQASAQAAANKSFTSASSGFVSPPVTCWLFLMATDQTDSAPGISAIGYVKDVNVKLNGPWLRGPNGSFNLPSSADFSFTFVHHPGHGNAIQATDSDSGDYAGATVTALADDVKRSLYNTRSLVAAPNYQSFNSGGYTVGAEDRIDETTSGPSE